MNALLRLIANLLSAGKNISELSAGAFGVNEFDNISTLEPEERYGLIIAKEDTVFNWTNDAPKGLPSADNYFLEKGDVLYGAYKITNITSGNLRVYYLDRKV